MLNQRYQFGEQTLTTPDFPGRSGRDDLDVLRFGYRPPTHTAVNGMAIQRTYWSKRMAMGRSGQIVVATPTVINEAVNNPYESDPSGQLAGDLAFNAADSGSYSTHKRFDSDLLAQSLAKRFREFNTANSGYARELSLAITALSKSDDSPATLTAGSSPYLALLEKFRSMGGVAAYSRLRPIS